MRLSSRMVNFGWAFAKDVRYVVMKLTQLIYIPVCYTLSRKHTEREREIRACAISFVKMPIYTFATTKMLKAFTRIATKCSAHTQQIWKHEPQSAH